MKAVFIRLDKIGDLVASLPVDELSFLKQKSIQVSWVIAKGLGFIAANSVPERSFLELDLKDRKTSTTRLVQYLKSEKPDAVIVFYAPWWVSYACWKAGVPLRVTRRSQWHSFLFFNQTLRQSRSLAEKHEADYNRDLVEFAFGEKHQSGKTPFLKLDPPTNRVLFEKYALQPGKYFVVHPGMAGSALNWPQANYNILIEKLINAGTVVITGTASDDPYLTEIRPQWKNHPQVRYLQNQLSMADLLTILKSARGLVAPSTGVLHLAASLGTHCVGIYSPVRVHTAKRWGPRGPFAKWISPDVQEVSTLAEAKPSVMEKILVNQVIKLLDIENS